MKDLNRCVAKSSALVLLYFLSSSLITRQFYRQSSNIGSWCWDVHNTISDYVKTKPIYRIVSCSWRVLLFSFISHKKRKSHLGIYCTQRGARKTRWRTISHSFVWNKIKPRPGQLLLFVPHISIDVCSLALKISKPPTPPLLEHNFIKYNIRVIMCHTRPNVMHQF